MAGLKLSPIDRQLIEELLEANALQSVNEHLLDQRNGAITVTCADGDQFPDVFWQHTKFQQTQRQNPRIHALSWHGGALACAPCSPVNKIKRADSVFMEQIADAREIKGIDLVALYVHGPCGAAYRKRLNIAQVLAHQHRAKRKVETLNHGVQAASFLHIDYGDKKRTYFVSRKNWEAWAQAKRVRMIA